MDAKVEKRVTRRFLPAFIAALWATTAFPAPGFITGAEVRGGASVAEITVRLACVSEYVDHWPNDRGERLQIRLQPTNVCSGLPPTIADIRQRFRPQGGDTARLIEIEYDGDAASGPVINFVFAGSVRFTTGNRGTSDSIVVQVFPAAEVRPATARPATPASRVIRTTAPESSYVINLSSSRRPHAPTEVPGVDLPEDKRMFESEVQIAGVTWYRLRVGPYVGIQEAETAAATLRGQFPTAWIARGGVDTAVGDSPAQKIVESPYTTESTAFASVGLDEVDELMADARRALIDGDAARAVQLYTKILQVPNHDRYPEALELLGVAREKNGQLAHAKAEYQRYLAMYPNNDGADRVDQRLAALLVSTRPAAATAQTPVDNNGKPKSASYPWRVNTYFAQFYRRDANRQNDEEMIVGQSAMFSDIDVDARRRGRRFDFSSRLSAGYRTDFLQENADSDNDIRVSYAYADVADERTGLRARLGRQTRHSGGVLGRFDGLNLGYQVSERVTVHSVFGKPVYSALAGIDPERSFYGGSVSYGPFADNLEIGAYFISQDIKGIQDRKAVGTEFRYFGETRSLWGMVDYDLGFGELASAYLQGSWRLPFRLSLHGVIDRRRSPMLSTGNALIGQPVSSFAELATIFSEDELLQLGLDRSAETTTYTGGLSYAVSPRIQLNLDASRSDVAETPASGGVLGTPAYTYSYYSGSLIASSLFREGDVSIVSARHSRSNSTRIDSISVDSRFPLGQSWRLNPRLRVDRRHILADASDEWVLTPGIRIYYRRSQRFRVELEAGRRLSRRESAIADIDRDSYFVYAGYQAFF